VQAPNEQGRPPAYQSVLLVVGLVLLFAGLLTLSDVLGADFDGFPAGAIVWTSVLMLPLSLWPAFERNSAICLLLAATFGAFALLAGWRFVFGEVGLTPYRWLLLVVACGCVLASLALREPAPRHAQQLVNAAGLAIATIGVLAGAPFVFGDESVVIDALPGFWEVVLLAAGLGLIAYGALDRAPGPAYLGVANLGVFLTSAAVSDDETLLYWPALILALGLGVMFTGLRPRRPLPPEPNAYTSGRVPLASRAEEEEPVLRVRDDSPPS
jgi:hypothetical protein